MAVAVVDRLEVVDVDQQQRQWAIVAAEALPFVVEPAGEMTAIEDAGQRVLHRQIGHLVGAAHEVADVAVGHHAAAVGEHLAAAADDLAVCEPDVGRQFVPGLDARGLFRDEIDLVPGGAQRPGIASVTHQPDERRFAVGDFVWQVPETAERAVDELRAHLGVEQHHADVGLVERRAQRRELLVGQRAHDRPRASREFARHR